MRLLRMTPVAAQAGSNLANHLASAAMRGAPPLHFWRPRLVTFCIGRRGAL